LGGIGGVIEGQAEKAVQDAAGKVDGAALAKIFPLLADVDEKGGAVRKRARRDGFVEREEALIHRLVDGRLLVSNKDDANLSWVEVAHEAVLRHWSRLSNWLTDNRDFLLWRRRLKVWLDSRSLLHGAQLTVAKDWRKRRGHHALTQEENALVSKSIRRHWSTRLGAVLTAFAGGFLLWMQQAQLSPKLAGLVAVSYLGYTPAPEMVTIPEGSRFTMGSPESEPNRSPNEGPQHEVVFANSFAIGKYEVTFDDYDQFLNSVERDGGCQGGHQSQRPGDEGWGRERRPAVNVSWRDATCYAEWLTRKGRWTISTDIVSPRKPNGNTLRGRGRRPATGGVTSLERTMPTATVVVASGTVSRRRRWVRSSRTPLASTTCSVTRGNGSKIVGMRITTTRPKTVRPGESNKAVIAPGV
jgi:hypothetical protein